MAACMVKSCPNSKKMPGVTPNRTPTDVFCSRNRIRKRRHIVRRSESPSAAPGKPVLICMQLWNKAGLSIYDIQKKIPNINERNILTRSHEEGFDINTLSELISTQNEENTDIRENENPPVNEAVCENEAEDMRASLNSPVQSDYDTSGSDSALEEDFLPPFPIRNAAEVQYVDFLRKSLKEKLSKYRSKVNQLQKITDEQEIEILKLEDEINDLSESKLQHI